MTALRKTCRQNEVRARKSEEPGLDLRIVSNLSLSRHNFARQLSNYERIKKQRIQLASSTTTTISMASSSASASTDPKRLAVAAERYKVESREAQRSLRIVQRKLDSATEEAEAKAAEKAELHKAELAELKARYERELKAKEANTKQQPKIEEVSDDDEVDEDDDRARQLDEAVFELTRSRSEAARLQQEAEKVSSSVPW